ncbi:Uncharacterised protein [Acinetobacter baumannii]|nr:Uncharacterised protein [Acinetobacter baumannii]
MAIENILHRGRHQEILLSQAQFTPGGGRIVRIEHARHVLRMVFIFHRREVIALIEFAEVDLVTGLRAPQPQRVGGVGVETGDHLIVGDGHDLFGLQPARLGPLLLHAAAEAHLVAGVMARKLPRIAVLQPVVRRFHLLAIDDVLLEHAVLIANAVAAPRQRQRRQRVEEAGRQAPQTAVAEPGVVLFLQQLRQVQSHLVQRVVDVLINTHRQQRVRQRAADQKLHRQVIHLPHVLRQLGAVGAQPALHHAIAHREQDGVEPVVAVGDRRIFADDKHQLIGDGMFQRFHTDRR